MATNKDEAGLPVVTSAVSPREKRLEKDKEALLSYCKACQFVSVKSYVESSDSSSVSLEFTSGEKKIEFTLLYSMDYPSGTVVTNSSDPGAVKSCDQPLPKIFIDLCQEWCSDHEIDLPPVFASSTDSPLSPTTAGPPKLVTQISVASSVASSEMTDFSDVDYFDDDGMMEEDDDDDEEDFINPLILKDIEKIKKLHGDNCIEHKLHAGINEMDILLYIDMGFLDEHTASAWGVDSDIPIVLHFHFQSASEYLDGPEPKVEVYQSSPSSKEKRKFGLGAQIQKIVETFIGTYWRSTANYHLQQEYDKVIPISKASAVTPTNTPPSYSLEDSSNSQKLLLMGFSPSSVKQALIMCGEKIERAVHLLTTGELIDSEEGEEEKEEEKPSFIKRQDSQGARATVSLHDSIEDVKIPPSLENGFLCQIMKYTLNRIPSLNEFCVICDERHILETGLLRPCVCTRELCVFAFQTLGVMADAAESVATDASVVDLLIAMCNAAAISTRASLILDPYPSIVDPSNPHRLAMDPAHKDYNLVKTVMSAIIMGREELLRGRCSHGSLKAVLDTHHILAFQLMQWIVATNRAYIVMLPEDRQLKSMDTKYQFLLISSPPAKEMAFQQAKLKHGSTFAFHGSSIENWHSIMRKGLINASGTKFQLNGAAYGNGIYLSPNAGTSFGYSNRYYYNPSNTKKSNTGQDTLAGKVDIICIAICEVVTSKELKRSGDVWVCPNSDHVVTRFFFVYDRHTHDRAFSLHTENKAFRQEIMHAIEVARKRKHDTNSGKGKK